MRVAILLPVLEEHAQKVESKVARHISVKDRVHVVNLVISDHLHYCEGVGIVTGNKTDAKDSHIWAQECGSVDQDVGIEAQRENTTNKSNTKSEAPEASLTVHLIHKSIVDQERESESTPGGDNENSELNDSDDTASCSETCQNSNGENQPADPNLVIVQQESIVGNHKDEWSDNRQGNNVDDRLEQQATGKANKESSNQQEREHYPLVGVDERPDGANLSILASSVTFNRCSNQAIVNWGDRSILEVIGSIDALHIKSKAELAVATVIVNFKAILIVWILNVIIGIALHVRARNAMASISIFVYSHGLESGIATNACELGGSHRITEHHVDQAGIIRLDRVNFTMEGNNVVEVHKVN